MDIPVRPMIIFLLGVFAFGGMFLLGGFVIDTLTANVPVYYPGVLAIINYTFSLMIAGSVVLWGLKQSNKAPGGIKF